MARETLQEKFAQLLNGIKETAVDFTTLDVITISGNLSATLNEDSKGTGDKEVKKFSFKKPTELVNDFFNADKATQKGMYKIEALLHIDFDQDTLQYYNEDLDDDSLLYELHLNAVESAKSSRMAMLEFMKRVIVGE